MADELRTALPADDVLTRRTRTALAHYRDQAQRARRQAASDRAMADITTREESRVALRASAAELDHQAQQWEALAGELAAFAEEQTSDPAETLL